MKLILCSFLLMVGACTSQKKTESVVSAPKTLDEAINSSYRSAENKKRDTYRHPAETLAFFGLTPQMTVIEIWPSGGWYTEILAPYLASEGKYIIADPESDPKGYTQQRQIWMQNNPQIKNKTTHTVFMPMGGDIVPAGTADMVLTFRNVHNWLPAASQQNAFKLFFKALKPGGILGVVEHRANPKIKLDPKSGYVLESEVIRMAKKAGFVLKEKSEINANPKDTTKHPEGVWTLPPRLRLGDKDKEKYQAIGESDRMTLKFVKPLK